MNDVFTFLLVLAVVGLFLLANIGERNRTARILTLIAGGLTAGAALLFALVVLLGAGLNAAIGRAGPGSALAIAIPLGIAGIAGLLYLLPAVQRAAARILPLRPGSPVGYLAVVLSLAFIGFQLGTQLSVDVLSAIASGPPLTSVSVLAQDAPLLALGFIGVGLLVRRSWRATAERLGLTPPSPRWWLVAVAAIVVFMLVGLGIDAMASSLTPATQKRVTEVSNALFRRFNNPASVVFLGVVAGIAEEVVFRGALVPRFGVIATAFLFAAVHTQYGITFASLEVFILGIGLGWLRVQSKSTLPCIVTHAGYDIAVGLIGLLH